MAASRVCSPTSITFAIKTQEEDLDLWTSNVVYKEVLLNPPPQPVIEEPCAGTQDSIVVELDALNPTDMDYEGPYDELLPESSDDLHDVFAPCHLRRHRVQGAVVSKSASPPADISPHPSLLCLETQAEAHEAWVASLPLPVAAPLTDEEKERMAMVQRRNQYFFDLRR